MFSQKSAKKIPYSRVAVNREMLKKGILHLLADDSKFILVVEQRHGRGDYYGAGYSLHAKAVPMDHSYLAREVPIGCDGGPSHVHTFLYTKNEAVADSLKGLQCRYSCDLDFDETGIMLRVLETNDLQMRVSYGYGGRPQYLRNLFDANKDVLAAKKFQGILDELIIAAEYKTAEYKEQATHSCAMQ